MPGSDATTVAISSSGLRADIARRGAELVRLQDAEGRDLLWNGDPAFWTGRSPLLFPIVGRLKNDTLEVDGRAHTMKQHGVARALTFDIVEQAGDACTLRLRASAETRLAYPFEFELTVRYRLVGISLAVEVDVANTGSSPMPASFGFHPAFRWPLPYGAPRDAHVVQFETEEPAPVRRLNNGLLTGEPHPTPIEGRRLVPTDALFAADALVLLEPKSRSVRFGPADGPGIRVDFPLMPDLGLWSKPGAPFLCIEPWSGYASPESFDGPFEAKPGTIIIAPGRHQPYGMTITLEP